MIILPAQRSVADNAKYHYAEQGAMDQRNRSTFAVWRLRACAMTHIVLSVIMSFGKLKKWTANGARFVGQE